MARGLHSLADAFLSKRKAPHRASPLSSTFIPLRAQGCSACERCCPLQLPWPHTSRRGPGLCLGLTPGALGCCFSFLSSLLRAIQPLEVQLGAVGKGLLVLRPGHPDTLKHLEDSWSWPLPPHLRIQAVRTSHSSSFIFSLPSHSKHPPFFT